LFDWLKSPAAISAQLGRGDIFGGGQKGVAFAGEVTLGHLFGPWLRFRRQKTRLLPGAIVDGLS
jgi:glycerol-3-phosphate acyltransferase PlsY